MFLFAFWSLCFVLFAFLFLWFLTFLSFSIWWAGTGRCFWFRNIAWWQAKELEDDDELWYFCFQDFPVLDLLLPWIPLESFVSLGTPAVWAESQHPEKEACWTGDLNFSCVVYESWLFRLFSPVFSSDCLSRFPGVTDVAYLSGVRVSTFSPPLFILLSATGSLRPSLKMFSFSTFHFPNLSLYGMDSGSLLLPVVSSSVASSKKVEEVRIRQSLNIIYKVGSECKIVRRFYEIKFSFHHKWNNVQLLFINMVYMSCLMSCQVT